MGGQLHAPTALSKESNMNRAEPTQDADEGGTVMIGFMNCDDTET